MSREVHVRFCESRGGDSPRLLDPALPADYMDLDLHRSTFVGKAKQLRLPTEVVGIEMLEPEPGPLEHLDT